MVFGSAEQNKKKGCERSGEMHSHRASAKNKRKGDEIVLIQPPCWQKNDRRSGDASALVGGAAIKRITLSALLRCFLENPQGWISILNSF